MTSPDTQLEGTMAALASGTLAATSVPRRRDALLLALGAKGSASYRWLGWAWIGVFAVVLAFGEHIATQRTIGYITLAVLLYLLGTSLVMFASWPLRVLSTLLRMPFKQPWQSRTFTLTHDALRVQSENRQQILAWPKIKYLEVEWDRILIYLSWGRYLYLHKRDFVSEQEFFGFYATLTKYWAAHLGFSPGRPTTISTSRK